MWYKTSYIGRKMINNNDDNTERKNKRRKKFTKSEKNTEFVDDSDDKLINKQKNKSFKRLRDSLDDEEWENWDQYYNR